MVVDDRAHPADGSSADGDRVAGDGSLVDAPVQMQQDQPSRRLAEVVYAGDGLLAAVATLVQVDRAELVRTADPVDLVRDRAFVGVGAEPGSAGGHAQGFESPAAGHSRAGLGQRVPPAGQHVLGHHEVDDRQVPVLAERGHAPPEAERFVLVVRLGQPARLVHDGVRADLQEISDRTVEGPGPDQRQDLHVRTRGGFGLGPEHHLGQEVEQRSAARTLGVDPRHAVDVGEDEMLFDTTVEVEREVFGARPVGEGGDVLAADGVQPGQAFGAGDLENGAVGPVGDDHATLCGSLFAEGVAVVPRGVGGEEVAGAGHRPALGMPGQDG